MVLVQIWPFFNLCFFRQYGPGKCVLWYSMAKKRLSRLWKQEVQKVERLTFFQRVWSMALVQNWPCFCLFLGNLGQENVFHVIPEQKKAFLAIKSSNCPWKDRKIAIFPKIWRFWSKICHFFIFYRLYRPR